MTAAVLVAVAVLALGVRLQPHPPRRPLDPDIDRPVTGALTALSPIDEARQLDGPCTTAERRSTRPSWRRGATALARALRGGDTLNRAVRSVAPPACAADALAPALLALERGASVGAALSAIQTSSTHLDLVVVVLRACAEHGGTAAEPIDRAAAALRQRAALTAERATQSAQARMSALVMTILPGAMLLMLLVTSRSVRASRAVAGRLRGPDARSGIEPDRLDVDASHHRRVGVTPTQPLHRRRSRIEARRALDELPDLVELVVIAVRAGATPTAALAIAAPNAPHRLAVVLGDVEHRLRRGQRLADALLAFTEALGHEATAFVDALATADRYGLPLGPVLDRLAGDIRDERRRRAERHARTLPVRLSFPLVTCTLPSFVLLAIVPALLGAVSTLRGNAP